MSVEITKSQWQTLGHKLKRVGYTTDSFIRTFESQSDGAVRDCVVLTERESSSKFKISHSGSQYRLDFDIPGTSKSRGLGAMSWGEVADRFEVWALELKRENEAADPWASEAEDMVDDDSHFTLNELPKVEEAIDNSLDELMGQALKHGVEQSRIETELIEIKKILKKSARTSTKREWITLFRGIIIGKLIDWGMETVLFQKILSVLIASAHDVQQLAEHASQHLIR